MPFKLECSRGHGMPLRKPIGIRGYVHTRACGLCKANIPRSAPRHRCRRCDYNVCYDCAMRLTLRSSKSNFDLTAALSDTGDLRAEHARLAQMFWSRVARKQQQRALSVVISKYYDFADAMTGEIKMRRHSRKRDAVAEDCHISYADVSFASEVMIQPMHSKLDIDRLAPDFRRTDDPKASADGTPSTPGEEVQMLATALQNCSERSPKLESGEADDDVRSLAAGIADRLRHLVDVIGAEVADQKDCLDALWRPVLPSTEAVSSEGADMF
eukprot:gb/GFBE01004718.1/.p1 GENE.gb/GFBE01004718.1/~~gb/GFBE01004718.1/.p1  ORF type:complete len:270 (+),score=41.31 gb/GFBE01004718.1/:1-810(+)